MKVISNIKKLSLISIFAGISVMGYSTDQKNVIIDKVYLAPTVCYGHHADFLASIPPPDEFLKQLKSTNSEQAEIEVVYGNGTPEESKAPFQKAVDIWSYLLKSDVKIRISVTWRNDEEGVLGSGGATVFYSFAGAPDTSLYYPVPLAEKLAQRDMNDEDEFDIRMNFNSNQSSWYFGTDANPPGNKFDFLSVALHEICHGLGFIGNFYVTQDNEGAWGGLDGSSGYIFDKHIINGDGQQLIDDRYFKNPSVKLRQEFTSNDLFWDGFIISKKNGENIPKLYSPSVWDNGSSIYHLDDATYPANNVNTLMTHSTGTGQASHTPGPLVLDMFADMGWLHTRLDHVPVKDIEILDKPIEVFVTIKSDNPPVKTSYLLHYSYDGFATSESVNLTATENEDEYKAIIPVSKLETTVNYYISANDSYDRIFNSPQFATDSTYLFYVGKDVKAPVITHTPITYVLENEDSLYVRTKARDNLGIDTVYIEYLINGEPKPSFYLTHDTLEFYEGHFLFVEGDLEIDDIIEYRIVAQDSAIEKNAAYDPSEGYYTLKVEAIRETLAEYQYDFNTYVDDFLGVKEGKDNYNDISFFISTPDGFNDGCLHTPNPYKSPDQENSDLEYIAQLKTPIKLRDDAAMRFDEIVLVEPGERGTVFGDDEFWDYVIIEGSKDFGKTWKPFKGGWDSRRNRAWATQYEANIVGNNSETVASPEMYYSHLIDLVASGDFKGGDEILIRFRLYSDPFAHGWGWAIDNLFIQGEVSSVPKSFDNSFISIYPNPTTGILNINTRLEQKVNSMDIKVYDIYGKLIYHDREDEILRTLNRSIDLSENAKGLYMVVLQSENDKRTFKILLQ